jgi:hypothetical protein
MYTKPPSFELPSSIKFLEESATPNKEPLSLLLQRINQEQLTVGRVGLLSDVSDSGGDPYIVTYTTETIIDWETAFFSGVEKLTYVCLDETGFQRGEEGWVLVNSYRVLRLEDGVYQTAITEDLKSKDMEWITPTAKGKSLSEIPFVFVNTIDLSTSPPQPPLIDLSNISISIYKQSADYNQSLFYQAQPTLVRTGAEGMDPNDKNTGRTGAGALVDLPTGGTLAFVEVAGAGLSEMRTSLDSLKAQASVFSSAFLKDGGANASGEALKVRLESASATLKNIALTAAMGLEQALEYCLIFAGGTGIIDVSPNLDFSSNQLMASELKVLTEAKNAGAPISDAQIHRYLQTMDFTDLSFTQAMDEIDKEKKELAREKGTPEIE